MRVPQPGRGTLGDRFRVTPSTGSGTRSEGCPCSRKQPERTDPEPPDRSSAVPPRERGSSPHRRHPHCPPGPELWGCLVPWGSTIPARTPVRGGIHQHRHGPAGHTTQRFTRLTAALGRLTRAPSRSGTAGGGSRGPLAVRRFSAPARGGRGRGRSGFVEKRYREFPARRGPSQQRPERWAQRAGSCSVPAGPSRRPRPRLGQRSWVPQDGPQPGRGGAATHGPKGGWQTPGGERGTPPGCSALGATRATAVLRDDSTLRGGEGQLQQQQQGRMTCRALTWGISWSSPW